MKMFEYKTHLSINMYSVSVILITTVCIFAWELWRKRHPQSPPGTNGLPLIGVCLSLLKEYPEKVMAKWEKKYGPLYMVKFGTTDVVIIQSPEIAYEAFAKLDSLNDRPDSVSTFDTDGILMTNRGDFHKEQRRFGLNTLRTLGMGRRSLETRLVEISHKICDKVDNFCTESHISKPFDISHLIFDTISCVISEIIFGDDIIQKNKKFQGLVNELTEPKSNNALFGVLLFAPFLRYFPIFSSVWKGGEDYWKRMHTEIRSEVKEHQKRHDANDPRDFIDFFLNEFKRANTVDEYGNKPYVEFLCQRSRIDSWNDDEEATDYSKDWEPLSSFSIKQLVALVRDLFLAGTDTTSTTIWWMVLYLCKYPDVQQKLQSEIDDVLGQSGIPCMATMEKLPYVRAVIQEVTRIRPVTPLGVPHVAASDSYLMGYRIPKGAIILTNIWAIHHDNKRWDQPEVFKPERHLDSDGKFVKNPNWIGFNVGARSCLGQQLAKMELFITTVSLFRRFKFNLAPGESPNMDGESKVSLHPWHFKVVATRR